MALISITVILFLIMNPFGSAASFIEIVEGIPKDRQKKILICEMFIALALMVVFSLFGEVIFYYLGIKHLTVRVTTGFILFLSAIKILYPSSKEKFQSSGEEPFLVPIAVPMIAGPSLLAMVMLFSNLEPSIPVMMMGIFLAWALTTGILFLSPTLYRLIGSNGLRATEKLSGILLVLISVQRILEGVQLFISQ